MPTINTYNLEHKAIDLSSVLDRLIAESPYFISLFPVREMATATKCEWFQDQLKGSAFIGTPATSGSDGVRPSFS